MRFATCPATIAPSAKLTSQNARSESPTNINPPAWSGWPGISRRSRRVISHRKRAQRNARHSQPRQAGAEKSPGGSDGFVETRPVRLRDETGVEKMASDSAQPRNAIRLGENEQRRGD